MAAASRARAVTDNERALLLVVARWMLKLESAAVVGLNIDVAAHPSLRRVRELIAAVEQQQKAGP